MKRSIRVLVGLASLVAPLPVFAQGPGGAIDVPASTGQGALSVRIEADQVRVASCAAAPCAMATATAIPFPNEAKAGLSRARTTQIALAGGRSLARVDVPVGAGEASWVLLVAAPVTGKGDAPVTLWSGFSGLSHGEYGEEQSAAVVVEAAGKASRVLVGEHRADVTMCGRPALVSARAVDPATMTLTKGASVQNLSAEEREKAPRIAAVRLSEAPPLAAAEVRLLRATAASSAVGKRFSTLTDGDLATSWSEAKVGDGRGEFVTMASSEDVGIQSLDVVVRPLDDVEDGSAPKSFFIATTDRLFHIAMPEDAWRKRGGTHYAIKFPEEVHSSCVALVLDEAHAPPGKANARVTLAEVTAHTAFDGSTLQNLVTALNGGGPRAKAASALLLRAGAKGTAAVMDGFAALDEEGKRHATGLVDSAPCADQAPFFAARLSEAVVRPPSAAPYEEDPELVHARSRLRACGRAAAPALAKLVGEGDPKARIVAATELAALAPDEAVPVLVSALETPNDHVRREVRAALARAARDPRAASAVAEELSAPKLVARSEIVAVDILRAVGPSLPGIEPASAALAKLLSPSASFRTRYLLLAPAAELSRAGDSRAEGLLRTALLHDEDPHVRARAADVAASVPSLRVDLVRALDDAVMRVRLSAVTAFSQAPSSDAPPPPALAPSLLRRLTTDDWTAVRMGAARAIGRIPAEPKLDRALSEALTDPSADVRAEVIDSLAAHRAVAHADLIQTVASAEEEAPEVRARAILALGAMCDTRSLDTWTSLAQRTKTAGDDKERRLGAAAIAALGLIHPKDLGTRLAPLLQKDSPAMVREMAKAALTATPGPCTK